jgi:glycosyltransferase involved in cell wall biosynthesis
MNGRPNMRYLWLTWTDPKPEWDGQRIYSGRLIDAVAAAGADIDVLCFVSEGSPRRFGATEGRVHWWPVVRDSRPSWASVFSHLPNVAYRCDTAETRAVFRQLVTEQSWDAIVLDGLYAGWALPLLKQLTRIWGYTPRVIYVSHNHEESTRAAVASNYHGNPLARYALGQDASKARALEHRLVQSSDLVTAITPDDAERFAVQWPTKPVAVLSPGYAGHRVTRRILTENLPRRVVLVGSFKWVAKRINLEEFLNVADPLFASVGAELQVVGDGSPAHLATLRKRLHATQLVGRVSEIEPYLADARMAVVPERVGGGFKLKVLDYVFNRLPVAALNGSTAGTPLRAPETCLSYETVEDLTSGILSVIDDLPYLNRIQEQAYAACVDRFDWRNRGEQFVMQTAAA